MNDKLIETFLEEALELLDGLEEHLLVLEKNPIDSDAMNAAFRALHSIKGSASMFGFEKAGTFAHEVEAALDHFRTNMKPAIPELTELVLQSRDYLRWLIDNPEGSNDELEAVLKRDLAALISKSPEPEAAAAVQKSAISKPASSLSSPDRTWSIIFTPSRDIYRRGVRPESLVKELQALGKSSVRAYCAAVPPLSQLNSEDCWLSWKILLTTKVDEAAIRDIFIFEEGISEIKIEEISHDEFMDGDEVKRLGEILSYKQFPADSIQQALKKQRPIGEILISEMNTAPELVEDALLEQQHARTLTQNSKEDTERKTIRIRSEKLDILLNLVGELVTVQAQLSQAVKDSGDRHVQGITDYVKRLASELRATSMELRLVPVDSLFAKFKRLVRDLSKQLDKELELKVEGGETEIDKSVIDTLTDPLMHLVRNAADHGLEDSAERERKGKPRVGTIVLSAVHAGAFVRISVRDDGRGLNRTRILERAVERGIVAADAKLSSDEIDQLIFQPGFSTASVISNVSGRGVGLDVVKTAIKQLGGNLSVGMREGEGTEFTLDIPLTLAIIDGFLVRSGRRMYVIPLSSVDSCFDRPRPPRTERLLTHGAEFIPYASSRTLFGEDEAAPEREELVIVNIFDAKLALGFDQVMGGYQTVIKPIGEVARFVPGVSGAAILADGNIALILDIAALARQIKSGERTAKS
ncbi:MAG: chemotaxis protein CheA [Spirochaetes bacterium]|nr:chemotaxis protein CheA [Spirochaetota bacterium]MBU0956627.1 chemotaxis protein CheA [Spirochaetota bacterium]